ncbi:MAG: glucose-6-phosphate isomerase [Deltaproteobacteria bacterium]|nr:glucose-6-phosphate isomerase [Deltaproteobacteria bacterium]
MTVTVEVEGLPTLGSVLGTLRSKRALERVWGRDSTLWKEGDPAAKASIDSRLGWLDAPAGFSERMGELAEVTARLLEGVDRVVLLGMGGSSLCPEVLARSFGHQAQGKPLHVLDSTDPDAIAALLEQIDPARTRFLVASKSGGTIETLSLYRFFLERVGKGEAFVAITDPGSQLEGWAREEGFAATLLNPADIGGRFSALSHFGLLPAALLGLPLDALLAGARAQAEADGPGVDPEESPAARLAAAMAAAVAEGRDKLTLLTEEPLTSLGAWIEQLVAESTGKEGKGVVPVDLEPAGLPRGDDRLYVHLDVGTTRRAALEGVPEGAPLLRIHLPELESIGGAFFLWEMATALTGALLEVNPFDEPNVKEAKSRTGELLEVFEAEGALPASRTEHLVEGLRLDADAAFEPGEVTTVDQVLAAHLERGKAGDYLCLQAFLPMREETEAALARLRARLARRSGLATTSGFGPRFLHSSGQLHKGGPDTGLFLQLTHTPAASFAVPGAAYDFGTLFAAQARGDFQALADRGKRVLRIDLGEGDLVQALDGLLAG